MSKKVLLSFLFSVFILVSCSEDTSFEPEIPQPEISEQLDVIVSSDLRLNPSGYAPLSARLNFVTGEDVDMQLKVVGKNGVDSDIVKRFNNLGTDFSIPVHGLYANTLNVLECTFYDRSGADLGTQSFTLQTGTLLGDLPLITIQEAKLSEMEPGMTLVSYFGHNGELFPQRPFIFDSFGDIRWYLDYKSHPRLNQLFYDDGIGRLANGNFYFGSGGGNFGGSADNAIYEVDLFGQIINTWEMPNYGFHHQVKEKPNGNFLVTVNKLGASTIEDHIIEIERDSKEIINVWNLNTSLDNSRRTLTDDVQDWIHVNAVTYDESDNSIIISGRTQGLIKLTEDNRVVWIIGPHKDWDMAGDGTDLNQFLLQPLDRNNIPIDELGVRNGDVNHADFEWNWYQHAPVLKSNGNIMLFDNGDNRNFTGSSTYSRAVEFEVDEASKTIKQIWQYGKERGGETYSAIVSDVDYLESSDHVLFSPGSITFNGEIYGKSIEVDYASKEVIFEATITPPTAFFNLITFHRTERLPLYPE
ncbi:aryl-sulfate sulfotransferase [Eudoraea chungangensis]|uniref:aryl-sulfate sulfotransferase n=1 Tax=Eudoraea chungangensis TaxID=1481905 RepID=UPI0023ED51C6|nr:aryl-sulfate sulfotransferase [Eudoraea chungangensis]